jgi:hypothetical protein
MAANRSVLLRRLLPPFLLVSCLAIAAVTPGCSGGAGDGSPSSLAARQVAVSDSEIATPRRRA